MNILVVYQSKYGATKEYARLIAKELGAQLRERGEVKPAQLAGCDAVVYGGGVYADKIAGAKLVADQPRKNLVVFTVGLSHPAQTDYAPILQKNFSPERIASARFFHLRGSMDLQKLGPLHRTLLRGVAGQLEKKQQRTVTEQVILDACTAPLNFFDPDSIRPLVDHVRALLQP